MKGCKISERIIDYIEGVPDVEDKLALEEHLRVCAFCQRELNEIKKVYGIMDKDEVPIPEKEFFERLKIKIRQREVIHYRRVWRSFPLFVPIFAVLMIIVLFNLKRENQIEFSIPVSHLIETSELNYLLFNRIVDDEIISKFEILQEDFTPDIESGLEILTEDEREILIESIKHRYGKI